MSEQRKIIAENTADEKNNETKTKVNTVQGGTFSRENNEADQNISRSEGDNAEFYVSAENTEENTGGSECPPLEEGAEENIGGEGADASGKEEEKESKPLKLNLCRHIIAGVLLIIGAAVLFAGRASREFADWFCFNIYPVFSGIGSRIWGIFPFSAAEIFVALVILGSLTGLVFLIRHIIRHKGSRARAFLNGFSIAEITAAALFLIVTFNCLVGYNRTPFSRYSGLVLREYTADELKELTLHLIGETNQIAERVDLDGEGRPIKPCDFNKYAVEAMEALGERYEVLKTYYPQPKGAAASEIMSSFNLAGIYFPVTVEANFNKAMPVSSQGFTACHELSHLSGFIREDEANFIAFIACRDSESTYFRYSGYLGAVSYCLNALYGSVSREEYSEICGRLSPVILDEYAFRNEYWAAYRKKVTYKVSSAVNDTYLKANNQTDGTKSYGRMVDLLLAEYFGEQ